MIAFLRPLTGGLLVGSKGGICRRKARGLFRLFNHVVFVDILISTDYEFTQLQPG
jgi:hypothetical protein